MKNSGDYAVPYYRIPQPSFWFSGQKGVGVPKMPRGAVFATCLVAAAEAIEEALKPATTRTRTKLRTRVFFMAVLLLLGSASKFLWTNQPDEKTIMSYLC
jgi:hypothetical protein